MYFCLKKQLESFRLAYLHHRLRTEHNSTPLQLWTRGLITTIDATAVDGVYNFEEMTEVCVFDRLFFIVGATYFMKAKSIIFRS